VPKSAFLLGATLWYALGRSTRHSFHCTQKECSFSHVLRPSCRKYTFTPRLESRTWKHDVVSGSRGFNPSIQTPMTITNRIHDLSASQTDRSSNLGPYFTMHFRCEMQLPAFLIKIVIPTSFATTTPVTFAARALRAKLIELPQALKAWNSFGLKHHQLTMSTPQCFYLGVISILSAFWIQHAGAEAICGKQGAFNLNATTFYMGNFFFKAGSTFGLCGDFCKTDPKCKSFRYSYYSDASAQYCEFFNLYA
jgi:hypothetical protein